jgi:hypothetical protein
MEDSILNKLTRTETSIKRHEKMIEVGDKLNRLKSNSDFNSIFIDGILGAELKALANSLCEDTLTPEKEEKVLKEIHLRKWLKSILKDIKTNHKKASKNLKDDVEVKKQLLNKDKI